MALVKADRPHFCHSEPAKNPFPEGRNESSQTTEFANGLVEYSTRPFANSVVYTYLSYVSRKGFFAGSE